MGWNSIHMPPYPKRASLLGSVSHLPISRSDLKPQCHRGPHSPCQPPSSHISPPLQCPSASPLLQPQCPILPQASAVGLNFLLPFTHLPSWHIFSKHSSSTKTSLSVPRTELKKGFPILTLWHHSPMRNVQLPSCSWTRVHSGSTGFKAVPSPAPIRLSTVLLPGPCSPAFLGLWGPSHHQHCQPPKVPLTAGLSWCLQLPPTPLSSRQLQSSFTTFSPFGPKGEPLLYTSHHPITLYFPRQQGDFFIHSTKLTCIYLVLPACQALT